MLEPFIEHIPQLQIEGENLNGILVVREAEGSKKVNFKGHIMWPETPNSLQAPELGGSFTLPVHVEVRGFPKLEEHLKGILEETIQVPQFEKICRVYRLWKEFESKQWKLKMQAHLMIFQTTTRANVEV